MAIELYDYQIAAVNNLKTGSILCGGVGSGKTRTALAYYYIKVCGGTLNINGKGRTTVPKRRINLYVITTARKRDSYDWENEAGMFYEVHPIVDSWNNITKYKDIKNAFFIFDEQRVVGYGTWAKTFINIARHNDWILLSATPGDVWMDYAAVFIANGYYRNISDFRSKHVVYSRYTKYPKIDRYINVRTLIQHKNDILIVMKDNRKTLAHHVYVTVPYDSISFKRVMNDRWNILERRPIQNAGELCLLLRRIVNSDRGRLKACKDILLKKKKAIVFYNFNYELEMLIEMFENDKQFSSKSFSYAQWNGHKHEPLPSTDRWAYLVQYAAGAEAWNCVETDTMIFYSQNYSYKLMEQAAGRIDRLNTPYEDLYYYHLFSKSLIDKSIKRALDNKKQFNETSFCRKYF